MLTLTKIDRLWSGQAQKDGFLTAVSCSVRSSVPYLQKAILFINGVQVDGRNIFLLRGESSFEAPLNSFLVRTGDQVEMDIDREIPIDSVTLTITEKPASTKTVWLQKDEPKRLRLEPLPLKICHIRLLVNAFGHAPEISPEMSVCFEDTEITVKKIGEYKRWHQVFYEGSANILTFRKNLYWQDCYQGVVLTFTI